MRSDWRETQRRFYDSTAERYGAHFEQANPYFRFVLDRFLQTIAPRNGERILELGCSGGRFTLPLLERGCRVTGVDISPKTIEYLARAVEAHPRRGNLTLVEDDVTSLARVRGDDFDAVVGAHILHHVPEFERALVAARQRLRPGGRAVFLEPNPWNPLWYAQVTFHPGKSWRIERGLLDVWPSRVRRAFEAAGFRPVGVTSFGCFPPFILNWIPGADHAERALEGLPGLRRLFTLNLFRGGLD